MILPGRIRQEPQVDEDLFFQRVMAAMKARPPQEKKPAPGQQPVTPPAPRPPAEAESNEKSPGR